MFTMHPGILKQPYVRCPGSLPGSVPTDQLAAMAFILHRDYHNIPRSHQSFLQATEKAIAEVRIMLIPMRTDVGKEFILPHGLRSQVCKGGEILGTSGPKTYTRHDVLVVD
jgi:hypothetical protein